MKTDTFISYGPYKFIYEEYHDPLRNPEFENALYASIYDLQRIGIQCTKNKIINNIHGCLTRSSELHHFIKRPEIILLDKIVKHRYYYNLVMVLEAIGNYRNDNIKTAILELKLWSKGTLKERKNNPLETVLDDFEIIDQQMFDEIIDSEDNVSIQHDFSHDH